MNPFGGTPRCQRCNKFVYAAEQVMGPGRKLYHKPCLTCTTCSKRLDSLSLVEHDSEPYCKICHLRNFSTRDLRHANLPQAKPPLSPTSPISPEKSIPISSPQPHLQDYNSIKADLLLETQVDAVNETIAPNSAPSNSIHPAIEEEPEEEGADEDAVLSDAGGRQDSTDATEPKPPQASVAEQEPQRRGPPIPPKPSLSIYSRRPLSPVYSPHSSTSYRPDTSAFSPSVVRSMSPTRTGWRPSAARAQSPTTQNPNQESSNPNDGSPSPLSPTATGSSAAGFTKRIIPMSTGGAIVSIPHGGTSYSPTKGISPNYTGTGYSASAKVASNITGNSVSPKKLTPNFTGGSWSPNGGRIECPKCNKVVYHAEGVNAIGKRWHKPCLRCTECTTMLDSTRLTDKDGEPYCKACYAKLYGPRGAGYALLGRVG